MWRDEKISAKDCPHPVDRNVALGDRLGISKERVRQIENRALNKLRKELSRRQGDEGGTQQQQVEAE